MAKIRTAYMAMQATRATGLHPTTSTARQERCRSTNGMPGRQPDRHPDGRDPDRDAVLRLDGAPDGRRGWPLVVDAGTGPRAGAFSMTG